MRALTFFSPKDLIWPPRSGRGARSRRRETARGKGDGKTRGAGAGETQEEPAGIVGGRALCLWGAVRSARAPGAPSPPPRSDLLQTRGCRRGSPLTAGTPPARCDLGWSCRFACFGGFPRWLRESVSGEGISFFPFFFFFLALIWLCWGSPPPFLHGLGDGGTGGRQGAEMAELAAADGEVRRRRKEFCSSSQSAPWSGQAGEGRLRPLSCSG